MDEKKNVTEEVSDIQSTEVVLDKEEENAGIGYEIVIGSLKS